MGERRTHACWKAQKRESWPGPPKVTAQDRAWEEGEGLGTDNILLPSTCGPMETRSSLLSCSFMQELGGGRVMPPPPPLAV